MVAITAAAGGTIPSGITTAEELLVWVASLLEATAPQAAIVETPGVTQRRVQNGTFYAEQGETVFMARITVPLKSDYASASRRWWKHANEISTVAVPSAFTTN